MDKVTITLDVHTLETVRLGLQALQLTALQARTVLDAQVTTAFEQAAAIEEANRKLKETGE